MSFMDSKNELLERLRNSNLIFLLTNYLMQDSEILIALACADCYIKCHSWIQRMNCLKDLTETVHLKDWVIYQISDLSLDQEYG